MIKTANLKVTAEEGKQDVFVEREFDAPREMVFRAFTEGDLYKQWIGPRRFTTYLAIFEPRKGGTWRYVQTDSEGNKYGFHGVFHEVSPPEMIIDTFEYEGLPEKGHAAIEIARFISLPENRTKLVTQSVFLTGEDRDGMVNSGMEEGINESYDRLDELLEQMKEGWK